MVRALRSRRARARPRSTRNPARRTGRSLALCARAGLRRRGAERSRRDVDKEDPVPARMVHEQAAEHGPRLPGRTAPGYTMIAAWARSAGGNARNRVAMPTGVSIPPPTPWNTRNRISCPIEVDRAHRREAGVNDREGEHEDAFCAEPVARPARRRDAHGEADRVAEYDPFGHAELELPAERRDGDVDDRGVEDVQEERRHIDDWDHVLVLDPPAEDVDQLGVIASAATTTSAGEHDSAVPRHEDVPFHSALSSVGHPPAPASSPGAIPELSDGSGVLDHERSRATGRSRGPRPA